ncbi:MAG: hypothetical protein K0U64_10795 [Actinomycetia bacterium]|nr:hypothetical protein [Actinomycetes bacterium]
MIAPVSGHAEIVGTRKASGAKPAALAVIALAAITTLGMGITGAQAAESDQGMPWVGPLTRSE